VKLNSGGSKRNLRLNACVDASTSSRSGQSRNMHRRFDHKIKSNQIKSNQIKSPVSCSSVINSCSLGNTRRWDRHSPHIERP